MRQIHFFAIEEDILPVLGAVEQVAPLKYVRTGNLTIPDFDVFTHGADIPNLGRANADSATSCESFLVTGRTVSVNVRPIRAVGGGERYCMDQLINPDTIGFTPAGIWNEEIVLSGRLGTASESAISQELMKRFHSAVRKQFTKIKAFWVGPKALVFLNAGKRLTDAVQCPREFDLTTVP